MPVVDPSLVPDDYCYDPTSPAHKLLNVLDGHIPPYTMLTEMPVSNPSSTFLRLQDDGIFDYPNATASTGIWPGLNVNDWRDKRQSALAAIDEISDIWQHNKKMHAMPLIKNLIIKTVLENEEIAAAVLDEIESTFLPHFDTLKELKGEAKCSPQCEPYFID